MDNGNSHPAFVRSAADDLVDVYKSRRNGVPVVEPKYSEPSEEYHARMEYEDAKPPSESVVSITNEFGVETATYTVVPNDPIITSVAEKYSHLMSNGQASIEERRACQLKMTQEIIKLKAAQMEAKSARVVEPSSVNPFEGVYNGGGVTPNVSIPLPNTITSASTERPKKMWVTFSLGVMGSHRAAYDHVQLSNVTLLLATRLDDPSGFFTPPQTPISVSVDGMPTPVNAIYLDTYSFNGYSQVLMVIDRTTEN